MFKLVCRENGLRGLPGFFVQTEKSPSGGILDDRQEWERDQIGCYHLILQYNHPLHSPFRSQRRRNIMLNLGLSN